MKDGISPITRSENIGDTTLQYLHYEGCDPTIVMLHATGFFPMMWAPIAEKLAGDHQVVAPYFCDHREFDPEKGGLDWMLLAEDLTRFCKQLNLNNPILVGHSMGAIIALQAAADMPERVEHIGLLAVADAMPVHPDLLEAARRDDPLAYDLVTSWGHGQSAHFGRNQQPGLWMLGTARQLMARNRSGVLFNDLNACNEWQSGLETAKKVKCPALVIIGDNDLMTPPKRGQRVVEAIEDCQPVVLTDCGHMMMQEQPDQTLDALIEEFQG